MALHVKVTVGDFLKEKLGNMCVWLSEAGFEGTIPKFTKTQIVAFAELLKDYTQVIKKREFAGLAKEGMPVEVHSLIKFVESREDLHDKFWRYLTLFSETVA